MSVSFPLPYDLGPREWGTETLLAFVPGAYSVKLLTMCEGAKGGLQYHRMKHEVGYVLSGHVLVRYEQDGEMVSRLLGPESVIEIPPGAVHQEEALTDCVILECSTPHFNDRVRVDNEDGGLPTTQESEIRTEPSEFGPPPAPHPLPPDFADRAVPWRWPKRRKP